jgi:hypothetical protein
MSTVKDKVLLQCHWGKTKRKIYKIPGANKSKQQKKIQ